MVSTVKAVIATLGAASTALVLAVTALATAPPGTAECDVDAGPTDSCVVECPAGEVRDDGSGQCAAAADENVENPATENAVAPLQAAWEAAFAQLPAAGLPAGVDLSSIAPSVSAAAAALPALAMQAPPLPAPPPMPCFGFATPIPFVGFSTC